MHCIAPFRHLFDTALRLPPNGSAAQPPRFSAVGCSGVLGGLDDYTIHAPKLCNSTPESRTLTRRTNPTAMPVRTSYVPTSNLYDEMYVFSSRSISGMATLSLSGPIDVGSRLISWP